MRTALIFACNERYVPLAKGLVLSFREQQRFMGRFGEIPDLHFINMGCSDASLEWFEKNGVKVVYFKREEWDLPPRTAGLPSYADAQLCRPLLPKIVPGYDFYIWMDADIWLQTHDALQGYLEAAIPVASSGKIVICPEYHYGYAFSRNQYSAIIAIENWYIELYGPEIAGECARYPVLNSGFFALHRDSFIWEAWLAELKFVYGKEYKDNNILHYAEQMALNKLLYTRQAFVPLDPIHNYACGGSAVFRNPAGKVVVGYPPFTPIKAVHLLAFSHYGKMFMEKNLLYQGGSYLAEGELQALLS